MKSLAFILLALQAAALPLWADQSDDYYLIGKGMFDAGNYQDSVVILEGVVRFKPEEWQAWEVLGRDYAALGDTTKALAACQRSLGLHPDNGPLEAFVMELRSGAPVPAPAGSHSLQSSSRTAPPGAGEPAAKQGPAKAAQTPVPAPSGFFYLGLEGGSDIPAKGWQGAYTASPGGGLVIGYQLDKAWDLRLEVEGYAFSGVNYSGPISDVEVYVLPSLRCHFGPAYLLAAGGGELELLSGNTGPPVTDYDLAAGAGLEAGLGGHAYLFVEGKYNFILSPLTTANDVPVVAGFRAGL